jgi:hypothetical protein
MPLMPWWYMCYFSLFSLTGAMFEGGELFKIMPFLVSLHLRDRIQWSNHECLMQKMIELQSSIVCSNHWIYNKFQLYNIKLLCFHYHSLGVFHGPAIVLLRNVPFSLLFCLKRCICFTSACRPVATSTGRALISICSNFKHPSWTQKRFNILQTSSFCEAIGDQ